MLQEFKNKHKGERCFILGSGPSIKKQNLELLKNEITFCSNWFINHESIHNLNIDYFCAYDQAFVSPVLNTHWYQKLLELDFKQKFFPKEWKDHSFGKETSFLNYNHSIKLYEMEKYFVDIEDSLIDGATVIINFCIPLAIYMGCKEIVLLGIDNNYYQNGKLNPYFYDISKHETDFDSSKGRNDNWKKNTYKGYSLLMDYLEERGILIKDATMKGSLGLFEKVDFDTLCTYEDVK